MWRILLVDDDEVDRMSVRRALAKAQIEAEIVEAVDCPSAIAWIERSPWDCVLLDFQLPGGDGHDVLAAARACGADTPFVVLTGHGDESLAVDLMKQGVTDYISKPTMTPERLAQSVRQSVRIREAERVAKKATAELESQVARLAILVEAGARIHAASSVADTLERVAFEAAHLLSATVSFALLHDEGGPVTGFAMHGLSTDDWRNGAPQLPPLLAALAPSGVASAPVAELVSDPSFRSVVDTLAERGVSPDGWISARWSKLGAASGRCTWRAARSRSRRSTRTFSPSWPTLRRSRSRTRASTARPKTQPARATTCSRSCRTICETLSTTLRCQPRCSTNVSPSATTARLANASSCGASRPVSGA